MSQWGRLEVAFSVLSVIAMLVADFFAMATVVVMAVLELRDMCRSERRGS